MASLFADQTVLITGASSGFGAATALAFAKEGARLILLARRHDRLVSLANEFKSSFNTEVLILETDVSKEQSVHHSLSQLPAPFDVPDILINNAGLTYGLDKIWEISTSDWNAILDTNVKGVMHVTQQVVPKMIKKNRGHIINVGSVAGHEMYPGGGVYCASKHALRALTDVLRMELVSTPLRVSLISPGLAKTEFSLVRYKGDKQRAEDVYKGIHPLYPEDIAESILFIASRPAHVNIADLIVYPTHQASVSLTHREK